MNLQASLRGVLAISTLAWIAPLAAQCTNTLSPFGPAVINSVMAFARLPSGLVAGGNFVGPTGAGLDGIALWNGTAWASVGGGISGTVNALTALPNGDLVAGGSFQTAGGVFAPNIARWDGTSWSPFGGGLNAVHALATLPNGDLVAGGYFGVMRWTGVAWQPLGGTSGPVSGSGHVDAMTTLPNGDLVVGGNFILPGAAGPFPHNIARWNGTAWSTIGLGQFTSPMRGPVTALATLPNGHLVAGGFVAGFPPVTYVVRWDGGAWTSLGPLFTTPGTVFSLRALPNCDLFAAGQFTAIGGVPANGIARWNGASWSAVGTGVAGVVWAMNDLANGDIVLGGTIPTIGSASPAHVTRLSTTCPATATTSGVGCAGSGGGNTLVAETLPWVGATFRATGTGLPATSLIPTLTGFTSIAQGAAPLSLVFAQAGPGCDVLVAPDILGLLITTIGTAQSWLSLPNTPTLVGVTFYHQMVPIELDAQGAWVSVTATNALQLTVGSF